MQIKVFTFKFTCKRKKNNREFTFIFTDHQQNNHLVQLQGRRESLGYRMKVELIFCSVWNGKCWRMGGGDGGRSGWGGVAGLSRCDSSESFHGEKKVSSAL